MGAESWFVPFSLGSLDCLETRFLGSNVSMSRFRFSSLGAGELKPSPFTALSSLSCLTGVDMLLALGVASFEEIGDWSALLLLTRDAREIVDGSGVDDSLVTGTSSIGTSLSASLVVSDILSYTVGLVVLVIIMW